MSWIYLFKGWAEPIASGVTRQEVYAIAKSVTEAIEKVSQQIPGNYKVGAMEKIAELSGFGSEVFTPEHM